MEIKEDVQEIVTPPSDDTVVEPPKSGGDDKDKNFAELRKQLDKANADKAELQRQLAEKRSLDGGEEEEPDEKKTVEQIVFERDQKDAVREWNKKNNVPSDVWEKVKGKVALTGSETKGEILDKIEEAYQALPEVRQAREAKIAKEAREKAMRDFSDDELDLGGGGDVDLGGDTAPRFTTKESAILKMANVTADERKKIDKNANPNEWSTGPNPTRKFFARGG